MANSGSERKTQLHYWYVGEHEIEGKLYKMGHGIVTGHKKLLDTIDAHTSAIQEMHIDEEAEELVLTTVNTVFHCPLSYCRFDKQDKYPNAVPNYKNLKKKYKNSIRYPSIEQGNVLLVLANFCYYYFHSLYYVPKDSEDGKPVEFMGYPHVGMFQDSFLVWADDYKIDLRYFPHPQNIEFYSEDTKGCPLFLENIGDVVLYARTSVGKIRLEPGERKEVKKKT